MPPAWPKEVTECIWAHMVEGRKPKHITQLLNDGNAGLDVPYPISYYTVLNRCHVLRKQRGDPATHVAEGRELDATGAMRRRTLEFVREQLAKLLELETPNAQQRKAILDYSQLLDRTEKNLRDMEREKSAAQVAGGKAEKGPRRNLLAEISKAEDARRRDAGGGRRSAGAAKSEPPPPDTPSPQSAQPPEQGTSDRYATSGVPWPD